MKTSSLVLWVGLTSSAAFAQNGGGAVYVRDGHGLRSSKLMDPAVSRKDPQSAFAKVAKAFHVNISVLRRSLCFLGDPAAVERELRNVFESDVSPQGSSPAIKDIIYDEAQELFQFQIADARLAKQSTTLSQADSGAAYASVTMSRCGAQRLRPESKLSDLRTARAWDNVVGTGSLAQASILEIAMDQEAEFMTSSTQTHLYTVYKVPGLNQACSLQLFSANAEPILKKGETFALFSSPTTDKVQLNFYSTQDSTRKLVLECESDSNALLSEIENAVNGLVILHP